MKRSLQEIARAIDARILGDCIRELSGIAEAAQATSKDLIFVEDQRYLSGALQSQAGAIVCGDFAASAQTDKPLLIVRHPKLGFARAAALLAEIQDCPSGVHPSAAVHPSVQLGLQTSVEAHAVLAEGVVVGAGTRIGPGSVIGRDVRIGSGCTLVAKVTIYSRTCIGDRVTVHAGAVLGGDGFGFVRDPESGHYEKFPQAGTLVIGDDVEIGCNTTIDRGALGATVIGRGVKIDNLVQIAHNCLIGEDVVIAAQTGISGSCVIEDGAIIAGQVGIADHCRIEKGVILGAQCGVPSNKVVRGAGVLFWGTPARPIKGYLKELAALARLARKS
jgi:UDP-3-O-[3-hydroxymyristoyl] glucosamine N-acyltransferase